MPDELDFLLNQGPGLDSALSLFLASWITEIIIPLPSPLLFIGAAFFVTNSFSWALLYQVIFYVVLPLTAGFTLGAFVVFLIAYYGGKPALEKSKKYLRFSWEDVERFEKKLAKRNFDVYILFASRTLPLIPTPIGNILAGLIRMNPISFLVATFLGLFIRILILLTAYKIFGEAIFLTGFEL